MPSSLFLAGVLHQVSVGILVELGLWESYLLVDGTWAGVQGGCGRRRGGRGHGTACGVAAFRGLMRLGFERVPHGSLH